MQLVKLQLCGKVQSDMRHNPPPVRPPAQVILAQCCNYIDNTTMTHHLLLLLVLFATVAIGAQQPPKLSDQYGNSISLDDYSGEAVLAIVVSARKLRLIERWEQKLRAELPQLQSLRVADVDEQPPPTLAQVADKLRERVPDHVSILIDLHQHWSTTYHLDTKQPCLLLFDKEHTLVAQFRGRPSDALVSEVLVALGAYPGEGE
jgi:hypothetical protein